MRHPTGWKWEQGDLTIEPPIAEALERLPMEKRRKMEAQILERLRNLEADIEDMLLRGQSR